MPNILKPNQPARLLPETVKAVQAYRRSIERETKSTPSINASLNALIIIGWNCVENHPIELSKPDAGDNEAARIERKARAKASEAKS